MSLDLDKRSVRRSVRKQVPRTIQLAKIVVFAVASSAVLMAQSAALEVDTRVPNALSQATSADGQHPDQVFPGSLSGSVVDSTGAAVAGAAVRLTSEVSLTSRETRSDLDGQFSFADVTPGAYRLTISSVGFASQTSTGILQSQEMRVLPTIKLGLATAVTEIQVVPLTQEEIAQAQIKEQEQQRVLGVIPNFYVSYEPQPVALNTRQKFELAWKTVIDPVSLGLVGAIAGVEQATNAYSGYGPGAAGYAKRFGAGYADFSVGTFVGAAVLPSILKQDPRYFYKGTGTHRSRTLYALASAVICKGDNGRWQPNYSSILGSLAAGGISNLYYPKEDRNGVRLTFQNALIGVGAGAAANLVEEFLIPPRRTSKKHN